MDRRQHVLAQFGDFVLDSDDLDAILTEACRLIAEALSTNFAKVIQIEEEHDAGLIRAGIGWNDGIVGRERISLSEQSSEAFAIKSAEPVITTDISKETRFHFPKFLRDHGVEAIVNVPIFLPGRHPWGLLQVDDCQPRDFDDQDIEFLKVYAMVLGPVIDRLQAVHQREEARSKLSLREARLHSILDSMGEGFGLIAPDFTIIEFNREASRIDGRLRESVIGRSHWEVYPGSEDAELGRALKQAMSDRIPVTLEHQITLGEEPVRWIEMRAYPNEDGTLAVFWRDVTQRKAWLDELQRNELWLRNAIEVGEIGLWDWDITSGAVSWSAEYFRMLGYASDEVTPSYQAWLDRIHDQDREREDAKIRGCMDSRGDYSSEFRVIHADGSVRWLRERGRYFYDGEGKPIRMVGAAVDVTEPRQLQERQQVLVAELQHRTRNLIGVVRSMSDKTVRGSNDLEEFHTKYHDRLDALARAQGLLSKLGPDDRVAFDELIETEIGALDGTSGAEKVTLDGPKGIRLRSSAVQTLAMALHELATNSLKYGALKQADARLTISWSIMSDENDQIPRLFIDWRESGVTMPDVKGQLNGSGHGRELIEKALPYQLDARTTYELSQDGVRCTISIPVLAQS